MFLSLLFLHTHHHSHPPTKRKYNHPGHSPLLTCANANTSHLSICGRDGCAPPYAPLLTCVNTTSHPLRTPLTVRVRPSLPTSLVRFPPTNTSSHNPEHTDSARVCAYPARARALGLPPALCRPLRPVPRSPFPFPRSTVPVASTRVLEPLCAHARDTRELGSSPQTLPNPLPADRTVFDLPHLSRANKSRYTVELTDTALGPKLVTSSKQSVERRGSQRGATGRKSYRLRTPQCVPQRETSAFGCLAYSGRSWLGSCRVFPFVSRSYWPRCLTRTGSTNQATDSVRGCYTSRYKQRG